MNTFLIWKRLRAGELMKELITCVSYQAKLIINQTRCPRRVSCILIFHFTFADRVELWLSDSTHTPSRGVAQAAIIKKSIDCSIVILLDVFGIRCERLIPTNIAECQLSHKKRFRFYFSICDTQMPAHNAFRDIFPTYSELFIYCF